MSNKYIDRLKEIIEMSFRTLEMKIANGGVISKNEASFHNFILQFKVSIFILLNCTVFGGAYKRGWQI